MKIESLVFVQNCWLITYFDQGYWQYSILFKDSSFYTPDFLYSTAEKAYEEAITEIRESEKSHR